jgi:hypothetical protein
MTTFFPFKPSVVAPFQFSPTLDGAIYNATVPSLLFGNRFYLNLMASDGTLVLFSAISGSKPQVQLQSISWANGIVSAVTTTPHGYKVASSTTLTIAGCTPAGFNGQVQAMSTGPSSLSWLLAQNPGPATVFGTIDQPVNLIGGVPDENGNFFTSSLVFRTATQNFEVSP